jgi:hypothetical protein
MKSVRGFWSDNFIREIVREEGQTLIRSTCNDCGASAVANKIGEKSYCGNVLIYAPRTLDVDLVDLRRL